MTSPLNLQEWFGGIDIYLFDQLLKGRLTSEMRLLDAGCGGGRNLVYFFRAGYDVYGVDESLRSITQVRELAATLAPHLPPENFRVEAVEEMSFDDAHFDVVLSSAVLHFARDEQHWRRMVDEMWRVLKPGASSSLVSHRASASRKRFNYWRDAVTTCLTAATASWLTNRCCVRRPRHLAASGWNHLRLW